MEIFKRGRKKHSLIPEVTLSPNGRIYLNVAAVDVFDIADCDYVVYCVDTDNRVVSLRFSKGRKKNAYAIYHQPCGSVQMFAKAFLKHCGFLPRGIFRCDVKSCGEKRVQFEVPEEVGMDI